MIDGVHAGDEVEILDLDASLVAVDRETVVSEPHSSPSPLAVLAGLVVAVVALFAVVTAGNTPAPEPPTPLVTVPPEPLSPEEAARRAEVAELEAIYGVEIGDGPDLDWELVVWNIGTDRFQWVDDGFVGRDAETEWTIRPTMVGVSVSQRENLAVGYPGYLLQLVEGARLLIPQRGITDHVLVAAGDRDPVRFEMPPFDNAPTSDLVRPVRSWSDGLVIDEQLVLIGYDLLEVDLEVLGARIGRDVDHFDFMEIGPTGLRPRTVGELDEDIEPISFEEAGLTEAEVADIRRVNEPSRSVAFSINLASGSNAGTDVEPIVLNGLVWADSVARTQSGAALVWSDIDAQHWLSTSADGTTWSTRPLSADDGSVWLSGSDIYTFPTGGPSSIRRSGDLGRTWQRTRRPFVSSFDNLGVDDILIVAEETQALASDEPAIIVTDDYIVTITGPGPSFELSDPETGEIVASGTLDNSESLAINVSADDLLTIPRGALLSIYADANGREPSAIAITRWDVGSSDPEWLIQPVDAMFNDAVEVDFTAGDGHILAVVTTTQGVDYYLASTTS